MLAPEQDMDDRARDRPFAWKLVALIGAFMILGALLTAGLDASTRDTETAPPGASPTGERDSGDSDESNALDVTTLPRLCQGVIVNADRRSLFVDGESMSGGSVRVVAGRHSVALGTRANPRAVDVPCDAAVAVR